MRTSGSSSAQQGTATLRDYLQVVRRRKWIILATAAVIPAVAVGLALLETPQYQASAQVLLSRQNLANTLNGISDPTANTAPDRIAQTQASLARVPDIAERVLAELRLTDRSPGAFLGQSSVTPSQNSDLLTFSVTDTDPALAVRLTAAYARAYTTYRRILDTEALVAAREEVQSRIAALSKQAGPLYESLVDKEQQLRTMEALQTSNAAVVQTPEGAGKISPRPKRSGTLGLMLGIFLGVGLAFLRDALDTRVRSAHEIGERLELPLLARIPEPSRELRSKDKLVMLTDAGGAAAEAFRMLRTNLEFASLGHDVKSVIVTSSVEQEGKSTTVANLAVALARAGQRVILVDLDLRRPYVERFFELRGRPGVTQVAIGRATLNDALVRVPIMPIEPSRRLRARFEQNGNGSSPGRLAVLGSGAIPPDPGEFVASAALTEVLEELEEIADVVLVDAPPLLHVGDAMVLSAKVDAMIVVSKIQVVRRPMLAEVHRLLHTAPALKLGFVATGADDEDGYGSGYGYGYHYATRPYEPTEPQRTR